MKLTNLSIIIIALLVTVNCSKSNKPNQKDIQVVQKIQLKIFLKSHNNQDIGFLLMEKATYLGLQLME